VKTPVIQKPVEQKSESKLLSPNGTSGLKLLRQLNSRPRRRRGKGRGAPSLPPTLETVITQSHTFRFQVSTGFSTLLNITGGNLAGVTGGLCSTANSVVTCPASSMRVHKVTIWPAAQSAPTNPPEVVWFSPITVMERDESKESVLPAGITVDRAMVSKPPRNTLCADWFATVTAANQPMFGLLNLASGSIVDVHLSWSLSNNLLGVDRSVATATIKTWYYLYLDGSTTHFMQPIGKPTTF